MLKIIFKIFVLSAISLTVQAQQLGYKYKINDNVIDFQYGWLDTNKQKNYIGFSLPKLAVAESYIDFNQPTDEELSRYVIKNIRKDIDIINRNTQDYNIIVNDDSTYRVIYNSQNFDQIKLDNILNMIKEKTESIKMSYLNKKFFLWNKNESMVTIDYKKISDVYINKSTPIATAFKNKNNRYMYDKRYVVNNILSFYQSIPYDTLETNRGNGFSTPFKLLHENKGDCDTKLVAFNSVINNLYPTLKTIAVVIPNHAFIGIQMPVSGNEMKLTYKGINYVLAETAGPSVAKIGILSDYSIKSLQNKNYTIIPLN